MRSQFQPFEPSVRGVDPQGPPSAQFEDVLVADVRARLTPADMVDRKFENLLMRNPLAIGGLRTNVPRDRARMPS